MTRNEFDEWLKFHSTMFPEVKEWLDKRPIHQIVEEWSKAMGRTRLKDAMQCTRKMISGEIEHPNSFEISSLPGLICRSCPRQPMPFDEVKGRQYNPTTGEVT